MTPAIPGAWGSGGQLRDFLRAAWAATLQPALASVGGTPWSLLKKLACLLH
jgi:hypothetical protein